MLDGGDYYEFSNLKDAESVLAGLVLSCIQYKYRPVSKDNRFRIEVLDSKTGNFIRYWTYSHLKRDKT